LANPVWHVGFGLELKLEREDLGHPEIPDLWEHVYREQKIFAARRIPVEKRGLQCAGICRDQGVIAWMHLRQRANGRREAVHQRAEDEARHQAAETDEHKAYKERIVRVAVEAGFTADTEVTARGIRTDALVEADGRRVGWEVQLSTAEHDGPRSVRARAQRAVRNGITPAWHTDRRDYADRRDTQWTRSDRLPAEVIAKNGDLRVVSGYRVLDFFRCDVTADLPCPDSAVYRRCGKLHAVPKPRDILFDDMVRGTAGGEVVPLEYRLKTRVHRFWVPSDDRDRYLDLLEGRSGNDNAGDGLGEEPEPPGGASLNGPTCRPWEQQNRGPAPTQSPTASPALRPSPPPLPVVRRSLPAPAAATASPRPGIPVPRAVPAVTDAEALLRPEERVPRPVVPAPRPASQTERGRKAPVVDWRHPRHWSPVKKPCVHCGKPTHMRDDDGLPADKVCHEQAAG